MEVPEAELERTARRARRVVWAFRLIFYPTALILLLGLLAARSARSGPETRTLEGRTDQGRAFTLTLVDDQPTRITTTVLSHCLSGQKSSYTWDTGHFTLRGHTLAAEEVRPQRWSNGSTGTATMRLYGQLDGDAVRGSMTLRQQLRDYVCVGTAGFSAG